MRWGHKWGKQRREGTDVFARWGGDLGDTHAPRQYIRSIRGRIVPCDSCKRVAYCAMHQSFSRHRLHNTEWMAGTNFLHICDIYTPRNMPGDDRAHYASGRTRGKQPT